MIERDDIWLIMSALGGTITALGQAKYSEMTWAHIFLTLVSGFAFAVFFVKALAEHFTSNSDIVAAAVYLGGAGWNILLPTLIARAKKAAAEKDVV